MELFKVDDGSKSESDCLLACCHHASVVWLILWVDRCREGWVRTSQSIYVSELSSILLGIPINIST